VVMSTCLPGQSDIQAANDLRAWSEEQLIAEAKTGKRAHFGELYERHVKRVFRVIHRIMRNRKDMEDAVQDCLLNAFVHVKDFDERSRFATWLTRIAINAALAKLRKNYRKREIPMKESTRPTLRRAGQGFWQSRPAFEQSARAKLTTLLVHTTFLALGINILPSLWNKHPRCAFHTPALHFE